MGQRPAIQKIKRLTYGEGIHRCRAGRGNGFPFGQFPFELPKGGGRQHDAHHDGPKHQMPRQNGLIGMPGRTAHKVFFPGFKGQWQPDQDGGRHVEPENLDRQDRQGDAEQDGDQHHQTLADVGRDRKGDEFHQVVIDPAALLDGGGDGGEVIVGQHHGGGLLGHLGAGDAHGDADIRLAQGRGIIDAITGHGHDMAPPLQGRHQAELLFRRHAREYRRGLGDAG